MNLILSQVISLCLAFFHHQALFEREVLKTRAQQPELTSAEKRRAQLLVTQHPKYCQLPMLITETLDQYWR